MLRKQSGNMYPFVTHTWNPIKGRCAHDCVYCYMKRFPQNPIRLDEKEMKTDLGEGNFIFVGSSTDMFADDVPHEWICAIIDVCRKHPHNTYLFQSKNPKRMCAGDYPVIFGTTIETNREDPFLSSAPSVYERAEWMQQFNYVEIDTMVTIEPVVVFDLEPMVRLIKQCQPQWVNIGADSKGHNLLEPPADKIRELIAELERFTEVKVKPNLERLLI